MFPDPGPVGVASPASTIVPGRYLVEHSEVEQDCLHPEHVRGQVTDTGLAEPSRSQVELVHRFADLLGCQPRRCAAADGGDLQQRAPLAAHDHRWEAEPVGGDRELSRQLRVHQIAEMSQVAPAGE
jgi:hypothetical protein